MVRKESLERRLTLLGRKEHDSRGEISRQEKVPAFQTRSDGGEAATVFQIKAGRKETKTSGRKQI